MDSIVPDEFRWQCHIVLRSTVSQNNENCWQPLPDSREEVQPYSIQCLSRVCVSGIIGYVLSRFNEGLRGRKGSEVESDFEVSLTGIGGDANSCVIFANYNGLDESFNVVFDSLEVVFIGVIDTARAVYQEANVHLCMVTF